MVKIGHSRKHLFFFSPARETLFLDPQTRRVFKEQLRDKLQYVIRFDVVRAFFFTHTFENLICKGVVKVNVQRMA